MTLLAANSSFCKGTEEHAAPSGTFKQGNFGVSQEVDPNRIKLKNALAATVLTKRGEMEFTEPKIPSNVQH